MREADSECWAVVVPWLRVKELVRLSKTCRLAHTLCAERVARIRHKMEEELAQMRQELAQTRQELAQMRQELAQTRQRVTALETVVHNLADAGARLSVIANELADVAGNVNAAVHVAGVDAAVVEPQSVVAPVIVIFINIRGFTAAMRERTPSEAARMCHRLSTTTDAIICAAGGLIYPSNPVHGKLVKIKDIGDCQLLCVLEASPAAALLAIEACFSVLHQFPPPDLHVGIAAGNVAVGTLLSRVVS
eukprot:TRINITY_DN2312_c0_g1_i10.p1 TRINITY_DN2312_c0_g1~~TRINITY_DN2312_c0_g1_i10.p1  ORF type:complete len:256 (+),score=57.27 TRINITY_DN2312_c0_g1_i10:25-768(+)